VSVSSQPWSRLKLHAVEASKPSSFASRRITTKIEWKNNLAEIWVRSNWIFPTVIEEISLKREKLNICGQLYVTKWQVNIFLTTYSRTKNKYL
jgi:hypothetical protein